MTVVPQPSGCPHCRGRRVLLDRTGELAVARVCPCNLSCATCQGTGRVYTTDERGYTFARICACHSVGHRVTRFNLARLPSRCGLDFDEFHPENEQQAQMLLVARTTAMKYRRDKPSRGYLLSGPVGTGKTHMLCATLRHLTLELGVSARYVEISFLYAEIRHGFNHNRSELDAILPLVDVDVLAIDELGRGKCTPFELETLDELIARRYNANRTTLIATNYALAERPPRTGEAYTAYGAMAGPRERPEVDGEPLLLRDRVGERIWSRLGEMCHAIQLPPDTPDYRRRTSH